MRKSALLAFSLPLAATGTLAGHAAGYALAGGSRYSVHGYLAFAPQFLAVCVSVLLAAFALRAGGRLRGRPSPWVFAILPPVAFLVQEVAERVLAGLPAHALFERAVYAGLAAQAPIALLAYLTARALVRVADETADAFALPPPVPYAVSLLPIAVPATKLRAAPLPHGRLGRAPPR